MVRYFYAWTPAVVLFGTVVIMAIPYLAVIVLMGVVLAVLGALGVLVWTIASALYALARASLGHAGPRASRDRSDASPRVALNPGVIGRGETR
jgi:hypothetical protein